MRRQTINLNPLKPTQVFLILHERAHRPKDLEYEYMTGNLTGELQRRAYGRVLSLEGEHRAQNVGKLFAPLKLSFIVTDDFIVTYETSRLIAKAAARGKTMPIYTDCRIRESDLSYLTRSRFRALGKTEAAGDPNATIRDWMQRCPKDFAGLVSNHIDVWNELLRTQAGKRFAMVLHVEGFLLYLTLLMGCHPQQIVSLHIPRAHPIHVRLWPSRPPVISFGDERYWKSGLPSIFAQYS